MNPLLKRISVDPNICFGQFLKAPETMPIDKNLWIVETGRIRIHQADEKE